MIISRTPYRISFFGGGSDYHSWYQDHGGAVLTSSINHYSYIFARILPPFFAHKSLISWSHIEKVSEHAEIKHPLVKAALDFLQINYGVEIHHQGDLPARSGLGSSSAFTVGLLNALYNLENKIIDKKTLACEAIYIERHLVEDNVGVQDQIETAFGGINKITIAKNCDFTVEPIPVIINRLKQLKNSLLLFYTGISRTASEIAKDKIKKIPDKSEVICKMQKQVDDAIEILLNNNINIDNFGELLDQAWHLKKSISTQISTDFIDKLYNKAKKSGAIGAKLLGAGGGGFLLVFAKPENHSKITHALKNLLLVPFEFETDGSRIIYYEQNKYSNAALHTRAFKHLNKNKKIAFNDINKTSNCEHITKIPFMPNGDKT